MLIKSLVQTEELLVKYFFGHGTHKDTFTWQDVIFPGVPVEINVKRNVLAHFKPPGPIPGEVGFASITSQWVYYSQLFIFLQ